MPFENQLFFQRDHSINFTKHFYNSESTFSNQLLKLIWECGISLNACAFKSGLNWHLLKYFILFGTPCIYLSSKRKYERKDRERKKYFRYLRIICKYFPSDWYYSYSYLQVLKFKNYSYSYSYRSWLRKSIPIPICGKNNYSLITGL